MKKSNGNYPEANSKKKITKAELEERKYEAEWQLKRANRIILTDKMTSLEHEILIKLLEEFDCLHINRDSANNGLCIVDWNGANCGGILWVEYKNNEYVIKYYESQDNKYRVKILNHNCNTATFYYRMEAIEGNKMYNETHKEKAA